MSIATVLRSSGLHALRRVDEHRMFHCSSFLGLCSESAALVVIPAWLWRENIILFAMGLASPDHETLEKYSAGQRRGYLMQLFLRHSSVAFATFSPFSKTHSFYLHVCERRNSALPHLTMLAVATPIRAAFHIHQRRIPTARGSISLRVSRFPTTILMSPGIFLMLTHE
jgi:hypothetical protein